jgi:hypothetical protein
MNILAKLDGITPCFYLEVAPRGGPYGVAGLPYFQNFQKRNKMK